jgi:hypothetical protein
VKAWRFHGFGDMRLDEVPEPVCGPGHVIAEPLCVQPSVTEAQLAFGIPTLAFEAIKRVGSRPRLPCSSSAMNSAHESSR